MLAAPLLLGMDWAVWLVLFAWVALRHQRAGQRRVDRAIRRSGTPALPRRLFRLAEHDHSSGPAGRDPLAGQLIYAVGEPGYQVSLGIAFAIGLIAVYYCPDPEHSGTFRQYG